MEVNPEKLTVHPAAALFPMLQDDELQSLAEDIKANGLINPIVLCEGAILDGRNRLEACAIAGVEPDFIEYTGDSPTAYVVSVNIKRRHLTVSQCAMIGVEVLPLFEAEARKRQLAALETSPKRGGMVVENLPQPLGKARDEAGKAVGVSGRSISTAKAIKKADPILAQAVTDGIISLAAAKEAAKLPEDDRREVVRIVAERARDERDNPEDAATGKQAARKAINQKKNEERKKALKEMEWPSGKYRVIYADPPWEYSNSGFTTSAAQQYETMPLDKICALDVGGLALSDSVLFLWATSPLLREAFDVIDAWGFEYKTSFIWDKEAPNYGHYNSVQHEFLLIAVRGSCHPDISDRVSSVVRLKRTGRHSEKPTEFRQLIDTLYPHGPRIELFARKAAEGWDCWGNEVDNIEQQ